MKWKALTGFFVTCAIAFGAYSACSLLRRPENNPSQWMSGVVVSRLGVAHVQAFLDDSQIHGLKFFSSKSKIRQLSLTSWGCNPAPKFRIFSRVDLMTRNPRWTGNSIGVDRRRIRYIIATVWGKIGRLIWCWWMGMMLSI